MKKKLEISTVVFAKFSTVNNNCNWFAIYSLKSFKNWNRCLRIWGGGVHMNIMSITIFQDPDPKSIIIICKSYYLLLTPPPPNPNHVILMMSYSLFTPPNPNPKIRFMLYTRRTLTPHSTITTTSSKFKTQNPNPNPQLFRKRFCISKRIFQNP
jgi:hypothetical protein